MSDLGQNLFEPPTVKGWEGGRLWINSATMLQRVNFAAELAGGTRFGKTGAPKSQGPPSRTLDHYLDLLLATDVTDETRKELLSYFRKAGGSAAERIGGLIQLIMSIPEYQLI